MQCVRVLLLVLFGWIELLYPTYEISFSNDFLATVSTGNWYPPEAYTQVYAPKKKSVLVGLCVYCLATLTEYSAYGVAVYTCIDRFSKLSAELDAIKPGYFWQIPSYWWQQCKHYGVFIIDIGKIALLTLLTRAAARYAIYFCGSQEFAQQFKVLSQSSEPNL